MHRRNGDASTLAKQVPFLYPAACLVRDAVAPSYWIMSKVKELPQVDPYPQPVVKVEGDGTYRGCKDK